MAKRRGANLSLGELQRLAAQRQDELEKRRNALEKELQAVEAELQGSVTPAKAKPGRGRAKKVKKKRVVRRRLGQATLRDVLLEVLRENPSGMDLKELAKGVRATGYKTKSKNFENTVYQCVYATNAIIRDKKTKMYRVKGGKA